MPRKGFIKGNKIIVKNNHAILLDHNNNEIIVDIEDVEKVKPFTWFAHKRTIGKLEAWDVSTSIKQSDGRRKSIKIHRFLVNAPNGFLVDHIDRNPLNNRKNNLRLASFADNSRNAKKRTHNTSGFIGVSYKKLYRCWIAQIQVNNKGYLLGHFGTKEEAALAYNEAALKYHGDFASLNDLSGFDENEIRSRSRYARSLLTNTSGFRGVVFEKRTNKWVSHIQHKRKSIHIGTYLTPEEAAQAYNQKAIELLGDKAKLNRL